MNDYPFLRQVKSPIDDDQLRPLDSRCRVVQFFDPLTDTDFRKLAQFMRHYPEVPLRIYGHPHGAIDLTFLKHFPFLKGFEADVFNLQSIEGLEHLPDSLEFFALGSTRKRFSLAVLARFPRLRDLSLEGHHKDIEVVSGLMHLEGLSLRSITLPDLSVLRELAKLKRLQLQLGGTNNLALLSNLPNLRYLELWRIRGLHQIDVLPELLDLRYLFLQDLPHIERLPSMQTMNNLRRVQIEHLKALSDLTPVASARHLEELVILNMRHLTVANFHCFLGHPRLAAVLVGLCSTRRNSEVTHLLNKRVVTDLRPIGHYIHE